MNKLPLVCLSFFLGQICLAASVGDLLVQKLPAPTHMPGYSEYLPPFPAGVRPYEPQLDSLSELQKSEAFAEFFDPRDPEHFGVSYYEEWREVRPGLQFLAEHWLADLQQLTAGEAPGGDKLRTIPALLVKDNAYWPSDLPKFPKRPVVSLTPLRFSRVMEELGRRHPWTVYGATSDWETDFYAALPKNGESAWLQSLLNKIYKKTARPSSQTASGGSLQAAGLRILPANAANVPAALRELIVSGDSAKGVKYLLTFQPYGEWPSELRKAYAAGKFDALPSPATLVFARSPFYERLAQAQPASAADARELPLSEAFAAYTKALNGKGVYGLRGLPVTRHRNRFARPTDKVPADDDSNPMVYIFEPLPEVMGLYGKPAARNVQAWWVSGPLAGQWLLDGPAADRAAIDAARAKALADRGASGLRYRDYTLPMQVNGSLVRWVRPLVAWTNPRTGAVSVDADLEGRVQATAKGGRETYFPIAVRDRGLEKEMVQAAGSGHGESSEIIPLNVKKIVEFSRLLKGKVPRDLADSLVNPAPRAGEGYAGLQKALGDEARAKLSAFVDEKKTTKPLAPATFATTVGSEFEKSYWSKLVDLTEGRDDHSAPFRNKNSCDCAGTDGDPRAADPHCDRAQLPDVIGYLEGYYRSLGLTPARQFFDWKLDFHIPWWGGLKIHQQNLVVVVHGRDKKWHDEAVVFGDHYDTAYMADIYEGQVYAEGDRNDNGLIGHRHSSPGADDNHSATVTLMEAAKALNDLPLKRDVYLVHLDGEEFPADGLGSRALVDAMVAGQALVPGQPKTKYVGIYVMDMIGHDTARDHEGFDASQPAIFQISPGRGERAARLAVAAHRATESWNRQKSAENWDRKFARSAPWQRYPMQWHTGPKPFRDPKLGQFLSFSGEIRPGWHFRSSLYNTDIQVYSDAGVPAVLFMENYDINRKGYHDSMDNLSNIDLDYARGVAAIAIETVAAVARGEE